MEKNYVTDDKLDYALTRMWEAVKQYCLDKREIIDLDAATKQVLNEINLDTSTLEETAYLKALRALDSREALYEAIEATGYSMEGVSFAASIAIVQAALNALGVFIYGKDKSRWTAGAWSAYYEEHGHTFPVEPAGILIVTNTLTRLIGIKHTKKAWGTYGLSLPSTMITSTDVIGLTYADIGCTQNRQIVQFAEPDHIYNAETDASTGKTCPDIFLFTTYEAANAAAAERYKSLESIYDVWKDMWLVNSTGQATGAEMYYWNTSSRKLVRWASTTATTPYIDTLNVKGTPAATYCYDYGTLYPAAAGYNWHLPSAPEYFMIPLNKTAIDACLTACLEPTLTAAGYTYYWTCMPNGANYAYYGQSTTVNNYYSNCYKYYDYAVVPFAKLNE